MAGVFFPQGGEIFFSIVRIKFPRGKSGAMNFLRFF